MVLNSRQILWLILGAVLIVAPFLLILELKRCHNEKFLDRLASMPVTPLNQLQAVADSGEPIHIECFASGEPPVLSSTGEALAFQSLMIHDINTKTRNWSSNLIYYFPKYFRVSDNKGFLWIDASSFVNGGIESPSNELARANIATQLVTNYDKHMDRLHMARVLTIKKGAHISAMGQVVRDSFENSRYILREPTKAIPGEVFISAH